VVKLMLEIQEWDEKGKGTLSGVGRRLNVVHHVVICNYASRMGMYPQR